MNIVVFLYSGPNDGFRMIDKYSRNYTYAFATISGMRSLKVIRDNEVKQENSQNPMTVKDAKEDDYRSTN